MLMHRRNGILIVLLTIVAIFLVRHSGRYVGSSQPTDPLQAETTSKEKSTDAETEYGDQEEASIRNANSILSDSGHTNLDFTTHLASKYTKAIVMGKISTENVTWLDEAALPPEVKTYIYEVDNRKAALRVPRNKGHEVMVYLTYIIDHYDNLPDVSIFLHAHKRAWHNNELLNHDATEMITRLSSERVIREGYMNLRCHWNPGCPDWINPLAKWPNKDRPEEKHIAETWRALFPGDPVPETIGAACCAQFAVSRDRIRSLPIEKFHHYRNWLTKTSLSDKLSGRVFEYLWAKIFTDESTFCPDQRICYCDGYGVCFESEKEFDYWFELLYKYAELYKRLTQWGRKVERLKEARTRWSNLEEEDLVIPTVDEDVELNAGLRILEDELEQLRLEALKKGVDPQLRAKIAGRPWKPGDGY